MVHRRAVPRASVNANGMGRARTARNDVLHRYSFAEGGVDARAYDFVCTAMRELGMKARAVANALAEGGVLRCWTVAGCPCWRRARRLDSLARLLERQQQRQWMAAVVARKRKEDGPPA